MRKPEPSSQWKGALAESYVAAALLDAGLRVFRPMVDDEGVDFLISVSSGRSRRYYQVQVKGLVGGKGHYPTGFNYKRISECPEEWILVCVERFGRISSAPRILWIGGVEALERFGAAIKKWGDLNLTVAAKKELQRKGHYRLSSLRKFIEKAGKK